MNNRFISLRFVLVLVAGLAPSAALRAQQGAATGVPAHLVVTVEARHGKDVPVIHRDDVMAYQGKERGTVTDWLPLQGDHAGLDFFVLLDDASSTSLGSQLDDLRQFILGQPPTTSIGVGYMRNGTVDIVQNFTTDHAAAAKSLRLPFGNTGAIASPYFSVVDLLKHWPESAVRREILMVSDGIDRYGGGGPAEDPYVNSAVEAAQKAGVIIFTIYANGVGHWGHSFWRINWGQNYLAQIADETGGESYFLGLQTPVSFSPYLDDLSHRLNHQYLLTFLAKPEKKAGLQAVRLRTEVPNAELVSADRVWVPAGM
jgi:hypothetical protein